MVKITYPLVTEYKKIFSPKTLHRSCLFPHSFFYVCLIFFQRVSVPIFNWVLIISGLRIDRKTCVLGWSANRMLCHKHKVKENQLYPRTVIFVTYARNNPLIEGIGPPYYSLISFYKYSRIWYRLVYIFYERLISEACYIYRLSIHFVIR